MDYSQYRPKQLGQLRPGDVNAASIYSPPANSSGLIYQIVIANTTTVNADFSIYRDNDGTTYDQTTALAYGVTLAGNSYTLIEFLNGLSLETPSGNLAVQTSVTNALTFTVDGIERNIV